MESNRTDLNRLNGNKNYLYLTVLFTALSVAGIIYLLQNKKTNEPVLVNNPAPSPTIIETIDDISTDSGKPVLTPTKITTPAPKPSPTIKPSTTPKPTVTPKLSPTISSSLTPTKTPQYLEFKSESDNFSVSYLPKRKLYQDTEESGNRYTFYLSSGNFAIHTGNTWSWIYPNRQFTTDLLVGNQPTFIYEIKTQTIVDFTQGDKVYTIQCVHNGISSLKSECDEFLKSFKFLQ